MAAVAQPAISARPRMQPQHRRGMWLRHGMRDWATSSTIPRYQRRSKLAGIEGHVRYCSWRIGVTWATAVAAGESRPGAMR